MNFGSLIEIISVLCLFLIIFICWLMPALYNYLNTKSRFLHELYIDQLEANKKRYPERYISFSKKFKNFMRRLFK